MYSGVRLALNIHHGQRGSVQAYGEKEERYYSSGKAVELACSLFLIRTGTIVLCP
jgi:hypothetical protein